MINNQRNQSNETNPTTPTHLQALHDDAASLHVQFQVIDDDEPTLHVRQLDVEINGERETNERAKTD